MQSSKCLGSEAERTAVDLLEHIYKMSMSEYSLSDIAAASGESGFGGNDAWWVIILFAMIFGWGGNGFGGNRNAGEQPVTEAGLCNAVNFNDLANQVGRVNDMMQTQFMQTSQGLASVTIDNTAVVVTKI